MKKSPMKVIFCTPAEMRTEGIQFYIEIPKYTKVAR